MYEYKTVPAPANLTIVSAKATVGAIESFSALINQECTDGWEFYSMENIAVSVNPGCLGFLTGNKASTAHFNMLVFRRPKT